MLSLLGPYGLWMLLEQAGGNMKCRRPQGYTSICDLCLDLTNAPDLVQVMREQLSLPEGRALLSAARLWMERRLWPEDRARLTELYGTGNVKAVWKEQPA